jgi:hypothetical protein
MHSLTRVLSTTAQPHQQQVSVLQPQHLRKAANPSMDRAPPETRPARCLVVSTNSSEKARTGSSVTKPSWPTSTSIDDIASWFASTQSPTGGFPALTNPAMSMPMNGGPVGGASTNGYASVNGGGNPNVNGPNGVNNTNGLQGFTYDEGSWYDYQ